jgi:hypothetical protein
MVTVQTQRFPMPLRVRASALVVSLSLSLGLGACVGSIGGGGGDGSEEEGGDDCVGCTDSGVQIVETSQLPRLGHVQWENTIVDLFGLPAATGLSASFTPDPLGGKAFDNNQAALDVTPSLWADYQQAAEEVALMVTDDPALLDNIVTADLPADPEERARAFIERFWARAYRRPLDSLEIDEKKVVFDRGPELYPELDPFVAGVRVTLEAFLQSPFFVYRTELTVNDAGNGLAALSSWEIASRLSYALWNSMPDEELFAAAASDALATPEGLEAQIERLLAAERGRVVLRDFFDQLYQAEQYEGLTKSATLYPDFDPALGAQMRTELAKFVEHVVFDLQGGARELLTSTTTFVTPELASIYGIDPGSLPAADADGFSQVSLDPAQRSGLLTRLGFLAWKGTETEPDSILRGVFVNLRIICQNLPPPPDEAMGAMLGDEQTNRERVEALTGEGTCGASCHGVYINPAGFALEHYGAIGEYRAEDNGQPIDAAASFPFQSGALSYDGALEFSQLLAESPQVHDCVSGYWIEYLLGRTKVREDDGLVDILSEASLGGASTLAVVKTLLASDAMRYRLVATEEP